MNGNVVIIGAGAIGRAVEHLIQNKEANVELWDKDPEKVMEQKQLSDIVSAAEVIFLCVPSWSLREAMMTIQPWLASDAIIVGLSKGLEKETGFRIDQLASDLLPEHPFVLISGPMIARLIQEDKWGYAAAALASRDDTALHMVRRLFADTRLCLETANDLKSVAMAGVLKNIYAIVLGIADGLDCGNNTKGWIVSVAVREMQIIAQRLQVDPATMTGTAGLADLVSTGFSPSSNNHRVGRELALHGQTDLQSEGLVSIVSLIDLLNAQTRLLPLLHALWEIVGNRAATAQIFEEWLSNPWQDRKDK